MPGRVTSVQADFFATGSSRLFCLMALLFLQTTARFLPLIKNQADSFFECLVALQAFKPTFSRTPRAFSEKQQADFFRSRCGSFKRFFCFVPQAFFFVFSCFELFRFLDTERFLMRTLATFYNKELKYLC